MSRAQEGELRRLVGGSASSLWCGSSSPGRSPRLVVDPERREALVALMVEVATWGQLGIHRKPIGILNVAGYYDPLVGLLDHAVAEGFVSPATRGLLSVDGDPVCLIDRMAAREPPPAPSWITPQEA